MRKGQERESPALTQVAPELPPRPDSVVTSPLGTRLIAWGKWVARVARVGWVGWVGLICCGLGACAQEKAPGSPELRELERLAFVPASGGFGFSRLAEFSLPRALLVDRFELTRGDVLALGLGREQQGNADAPRALGLSPDELKGAEAAPTRSDAFITDGARQSEEILDWPAFVSFDEARELAQLRGMRLPTPNEWLHVATNGGKQLYPYHATTPQKGFANTLGLRLGTPAPVGSFENGRSEPFGCYDLFGNVWEWVDGIVPGHTDEAGLVFAVTRVPLDDQLASVMGGSYLSRSRPAFMGRGGAITTFHSKLLDRRDLLPDVGVRHVADAETYLVAKGSAWGRDAHSLARLRAVGAAWAEAVGRGRVTSFLERLLKREDAPEGLQTLLRGARGR